MWIILQRGTVVPLRLRLALEFAAAFTEQAPVLLEDAEVGRVVLLVVAVGVVRVHLLRLEHGDGEVEGVGAGSGDLLLALAEPGDGVRACLLAGLESG